MNIKAELRAKKAALVEKANALMALETDDTDLTTEQEEEFKSLSDQIAKVNKRIARQERAEELEFKAIKAAKNDKADDDDDDDDKDDDKSKASDDDDDEDDKDDKKSASVWRKNMSVWDWNKRQAPITGTLKRPRGEAQGTAAARFIVGKAIAGHFNSVESAANWARRDMNDNGVAKALNSLQQATGGALIPQDFLADLVPLLYSETVIRNGGAPVYPMPMGNLTMPRMTAGANAFWIGELDPIPISAQAVSNLQLFAKKLVAMTPTTMDLVRRSPLSVEAIVLNDLREQIGLKEDLACLLSPGTDAAVPPGLVALATTYNKVAPVVPADTGSNQVARLTFVSNMLQSLLLQFRSTNVGTAGAKWIIPESVFTFLQTLPDGFGRPVFFQNGEATLFGVPVLRTNLIPNNISVAANTTTTTGTRAATTTDNTYIFLVNFPDLILADTMQMLTDSSTVATYSDNTQTTPKVYSAYQMDQMLFRTIKEIDFNVRRPSSIAMLTVSGFTPTNYTPNAGLVYSGSPAVTTASHAGSASPVTSSPTVAATPYDVVAGNDTADGAPGGIITPDGSGNAYEGS